MVRTTWAVGHGEAIFSPAVAEMVLAYFASPKASRRSPTANARS
jgi:hypothetical protein